MGPQSLVVHLFLMVIATFAQQDLSWKADIFASDREMQMSEQDALTRYFGDDKKNTTVFPTWQTMKEKVGDFINVNSTRIKNHNYNEMTAWLKATRLNYPNITHLYSVGKSVEGRELWVLIISDKPTEHEILEPELKIVGNMHGNELVNNARFHLMPSMNPDGYEKGYPGDRISAMVL
uniref:Peptidase_M14 domain-containing protein n=1 Tax=Caenorhabditis japonica TaxID=281687 RepID=A0A8R1IK93_CAEJA